MVIDCVRFTNVRGIEADEDVRLFFEANKVFYYSLLSLSFFLDSTCTPATRHERPTFKFHIPNHKRARRHGDELYIPSGPNLRRPQKLTTTETRGSFHSPRLETA